MKILTEAHNIFILGAFLLSGFARAEFASGPAKEAIQRDRYEEINHIKAKMIAAKTEAEALRWVFKYRALLDDMDKQVREGSYLSDARKSYSKLDAKQAILKQLDEETLTAAVARLEKQIKDRPTSSSDPGDLTRYDEAETTLLEDMPDHSALKLALKKLPAKEGEEAKLQLQVQFDESQWKALETENPDLYAKLKDLSADERTALMKEIAAHLEGTEDLFKSKMSHEDLDKLVTDAEHQKKVSAWTKTAAKNLKSTVEELETVDLQAAQWNVDKAGQESEAIADKIAQKMKTLASLEETLKDQKEGGIEGLRKTTACAFLASSGVLLEELSAEEKSNCRKEIAAGDVFKVRDKKDNKESESTRSKRLAGKDEEGVDAEGDAANEKRQEELDREAAKRKVAQDAAQDPMAIYRQIVGNMLVPQACNNQSLNASLPFAGDPVNSARLDSLEQGMASSMTACKTTGFVDAQAEGFGSAFPLASGEMLASDAMSEVFPRDAATMTATEAKDLEGERKCLMRSTQAMSRGLRLTRLEVEKQARDRARQKLFAMRSQNPAQYSAELMRKQMELQSMGRMTPYVTEEDLTQQLYTDYRGRFEMELAEERKLLQKENDLKTVQVLATEVNNLYSDRVNFVTNSVLRPSTQQIAPGVSRPAPASRVSPSRRVPSSNGASSTGAERKAVTQSREFI